MKYCHHIANLIVDWSTNVNGQVVIWNTMNHLPSWLCYPYWVNKTQKKVYLYKPTSNSTNNSPTTNTYDTFSMIVHLLLNNFNILLLIGLCYLLFKFGIIS